ncbi:MAG: hypothetical protein AAFU80_10340 [Pseudomonadota bacterium]
MAEMDPYKARTTAVRGAARAHLKQLRAERLARRPATRGAEPAPDAAVSMPPPSREGAIAISRATAAAVAASQHTAPPPSTIETVPADSESEQPLEAEDTDHVSAADELERPADPVYPPHVPEFVEAEPGAANHDSGHSEHEEEPVVAAVARDAEPEVVEAEPEGRDDPTPLTSGFDAPEPEASIPAPEDTAPEHLPVDPAPEPALTSDAGDPEAAAPAAAAGDPVAHHGATDLYRLPGAGAGLVWMLRECGISNLQELAGADPTALAARMGLVGQILDLNGWILFARDHGSGD